MRQPEVECPIAPRISPYADATHRWLMSWIRRAGQDDIAVARLERAHFARYVARMYPDAAPADLRVLTGLVTWFFLLDDVCDRARHPDPERMRPYLAGVLDCLRDTGARSDAFGGPMRRLLREVWRAPRDWMPYAWRERFITHVEDYVDGILTEARNKAAGWRPSVYQYIRLRRATSGAFVCHTLGEFATRTVVPDPIYHHPALRAYSEAGNDLLSWFNDLISLVDDLDTAGGHNLVLALARDRGIPLTQAVDDAVGMWRRTMREFTALRARVPSFGPAMDPAVRRYLDGVANSVRATVDWSVESGRYPLDPEQPAKKPKPVGSAAQV
jgi:hypothetical protein